jgi:ectoine hydroxylase-related dioxygenase (phytanoyl-CoA dioxygenase family)
MLMSTEATTVPNGVSTSTPQTFQRPFPALTSAQRFAFETYGYVIVPGVLSSERCDRIAEALRRLKADLRRINPGSSVVNPLGAAFMETNHPWHTFMANFYDYDDELLSYCCDPRLVGMAEEVMGCEARITEFNGHINSRTPDTDTSKTPTYGFHTGADVPGCSHIGPNGLYHCNFVKTLTTLVPLGPEDGGTVVVAGSHKFNDVKSAIAAAYEDRRLIHQFIAPKGSVLLFAETLIHATGRITSDIERSIIITGYGPRMYPRWDGSDVRPDGYAPGFAARVPEALKTLFFGKHHWLRGHRYRNLADPVDAKEYPAVAWKKR